MDLEWNWRDRRNILGGKSPLGKSSVSTDKGFSNRQQQEKSDLLQFSDVASSLFEDAKKDHLKTRMDKLFAEMKPQSEPVFGKSVEEKDLERQRKVKEKFGNMLDDSMVFSMKKTKVQVFSLMKMEQFGDASPTGEDILESGGVECEPSATHRIGDASCLRGISPEGDQEFIHEGVKPADAVQERKLHNPSDPIPIDSKPYIMEIIKDHERLMKMASSIIKSNAADFPLEVHPKPSLSENLRRMSHSKETVELEVRTPSHFLAEVEEVEEVKVEDLLCKHEGTRDSEEKPSAGKEPQVEKPVTRNESQTSFHGTGQGEENQKLESQPKSLKLELEEVSNESLNYEGEKENPKPEDLEDCLDEDMYDKIMAWLESNEVVQEEDVYSSETPKIEKESEKAEHPPEINMEDDAETSFCPSAAGDVNTNTNEGQRESFCSYCEELHKIAEMSNKSALSSDSSEKKTLSKTKSQEDPSFILTREEPHKVHHLAPYLEHHAPDCKARPSFFRHLRKLYKKLLGSDGKGNKRFSLINRLYLCYPLSFCFTPENHGGSSYLSVKTSDISFEADDRQDSFLHNCSPSLIMDGTRDTEEETKRKGPHEADSKVESCAGDSVFSYSRKTVPGITTV